MNYPVNEKICKNCKACSLVTKSISFKDLPEKDWYYQCLAGMESECEEEYYDEPSGHGVYGSSNPWDAPGMKLSDFF